MIPNLKSLSLIDTIPVDLSRPIDGYSFLNVELDLSIFNGLFGVVPFEFVYGEFIELAGLQHIFNVGHLIWGWFFLV